MEFRLSVHHIGGRAGTRIFPILDKFEKDMINVLYDADSDCLSQIQERNKNLESELHVLPYCLGNACKTASFNLNYDPYTSSLRDFDSAYEGFYSFNGLDYILSDVCRTVEKRQVELVTLDSIFELSKVSVPVPDLLSIDTEGTEYEILEGAKNILQSSVLALVLEVRFHPVCKKQKLFGDIVKLLSEQGFVFAKFTSLHEETSPFRAPIGLRGEGFNLGGDALFFKQISEIDKKDNRPKILMLYKLAFIAIVFNQFEYALKCLNSLKTLKQEEISREFQNVSYYKFLKDFEEQVEKMPLCFPKTFSEQYSFEASKARFETKDSNSTIKESLEVIKKILRTFPILLSIVKKLRDITFRFHEEILPVKLFLYKVFKRYSSVEKTLLDYGLVNQSEILMKNRLIQSKSCITDKKRS